ncbi:MAG: hypothetical protein ACRERV_16675, partial [Methylococcales bacterium]
MRLLRCNSLFYSLFLAVLLMTWVANVQSFVIDDFSTLQTNITAGAIPASSSASGAGILGGERDLAITRTAGTGTCDLGVPIANILNFNSGANATCLGDFVYDGSDGSSTLMATGLSGFDLTRSGSQDALFVRVEGTEPNITSMVVRVFTNATDFSDSTLMIPASIVSPTDITIPFASFLVAGGSGANFANVGAIRFRYTGPT